LLFHNAPTKFRLRRTKFVIVHLYNLVYTFENLSVSLSFWISDGITIYAVFSVQRNIRSRVKKNTFDNLRFCTVRQNQHIVYHTTSIKKKKILNKNIKGSFSCCFSGVQMVILKIIVRLKIKTAECQSVRSRGEQQKGDKACTIQNPDVTNFSHFFF